jgi:hypothetical protein
MYLYILGVLYLGEAAKSFGALRHHRARSVVRRARSLQEARSNNPTHGRDHRRPCLPVPAAAARSRAPWRRAQLALVRRRCHSRCCAGEIAVALERRGVHRLSRRQLRHLQIRTGGAGLCRCSIHNYLLPEEVSEGRRAAASRAGARGWRRADAAGQLVAQGDRSSRGVPATIPSQHRHRYPSLTPHAVPYDVRRLRQFVPTTLV